MSLSPLLFEDRVCPRRNWITSIFSPEEALYPITNILNELAQIEKDNSITIDKNHFQVNIDVQQFKPDEVSVILSGNTVIIEGKHEEKQDEHGSISRHFVRRYELPEDCDVEKLQSKLSSDGVLSITAPKTPEEKQEKCTQIPITRTGPVHSVEQKPKKDDANKS